MYNQGVQRSDGTWCLVQRIETAHGDSEVITSFTQKQREKHRVDAHDKGAACPEQAQSSSASLVSRRKGLVARVSVWVVFCFD